MTLLPAMLIFLVSSARAELPGDAANGKRLHDANCVTCHNAEIYARKDRVVRSLDALKRQLAGCNHMAKTNFSPDQIQDIVKYLNEQFYKFQ